MTGFNSDLGTVDIKASGPEAAGFEVDVIEGRTSSEVLELRLEEAGLPTERGVDVQRRSKGPQGTENWTTGKPTQIDGNYGVIAGDGLLIIDDDSYKPDEELSAAMDALLSEYPTFSVESANGGRHHYYRVSETTPEKIERASPTNSRNPHHDAGEIKSEDTYVVGPGSRLPAGEYTIQENREIATLGDDAILRLLHLVDDSGDGTENQTTELGSKAGLRLPERKWLETALEADDYLCELWEWGRKGDDPSNYGELDFTDRSRNTTALAEKLLWRYGGVRNSEQIVRRLLNEANPPKWAGYEDHVMEYARRYTVDRGEFYEIEQDALSENGDSIGVLREHAEIIINWLRYGEDFQDGFRTVTISETQTQLSDRQVRRVLTNLRDAGYLSHERRGREGYWVKQTELPAYGRERELLLNQYLTLDDLKQQRKEWMGGTVD